MRTPSILWRRLDQPGHESARCVFNLSWWRLDGTAVFQEGEKACRLDYVILCDSRMRTAFAKVLGWTGSEEVAVRLSVEPRRPWRLNGAEYPQTAGCIDLDLEFSPATNMIPIRRLQLAVGAETLVRSAWLRFPSLTLEPLEQIYRRLDDTTYRYMCGDFTADLTVNGDGFITAYPGLWEVEAPA